MKADWDTSTRTWRIGCPHCNHVETHFTATDAERKMTEHIDRQHSGEVKLDLRAVVAKAKDLYELQMEQTGGEKNWDALHDWQQLSWYMEAADELRMSL